MKVAIMQCMPIMIAGGPPNRPWWCNMCGAQPATRMCNTPSWNPAPKSGGPPSIIDMIPLLLCKDPACNQKASRETKIITKEWHSEMRAAGEATSRKTEVEMCDNCGKVQARAEEGSDTHSKELKKRCRDVLKADNYIIFCLFLTSRVFTDLRFPSEQKILASLRQLSYSFPFTKFRS